MCDLNRMLLLLLPVNILYSYIPGKILTSPSGHSSTSHCGIWWRPLSHMKDIYSGQPQVELGIKPIPQATPPPNLLPLCSWEWSWFLLLFLHLIMNINLFISSTVSIGLGELEISIFFLQKKNNILYQITEAGKMWRGHTWRGKRQAWYMVHDTCQ